MKKEFLVLLGVIVNNELKWNGHVTKIQNECHYSLYVFRRLRHVFSNAHHYRRYYQHWTGSEFVRDSRSTVMNNYLQMIQSDMTITAPSQQTNR